MVAWISFARENRRYLWGDKDTFGIAFAAAGKAHLFSQVAVPPGENCRDTTAGLNLPLDPTTPVAPQSQIHSLLMTSVYICYFFIILIAAMLTWSEDMLEVKCPSRCLRPSLLPGWKLIGFVQARNDRIDDILSLITSICCNSMYRVCLFPADFPACAH